jgi:hypothetical protein
MGIEDFFGVGKRAIQQSAGSCDLPRKLGIYSLNHVSVHGHGAVSVWIVSIA